MKKDKKRIIKLNVLSQECLNKKELVYMVGGRRASICQNKPMTINP